MRTSTTTKIMYRTSHRYGVDNRYLDDYEEVAEGQVIRLHPAVYLKRSIFDPVVEKYLIKTTHPLTEDVLWNCLDHLFAEGCSCEEDCCGHLQGGVTELHAVDSYTTCITCRYYPNY
jgi:hypothetical protein